MKKEASFFLYLSRGLLAAIFLAVFLFSGVALAQNWTNPTADPPNENPAGFIIASPNSPQSAFIDIDQDATVGDLLISPGDARILSGALCFGQVGVDKCIDFNTFDNLGQSLFSENTSRFQIYTDVDNSGGETGIDIQGGSQSHVVLSSGDTGAPNESIIQAFNKEDWVELRNEKPTAGNDASISSIRWGDDTNDLFQIQNYSYAVDDLDGEIGGGPESGIRTALTIEPWVDGINGGFVGIGVTDPARNLHVADDIRLDGGVIWFGGTGHRLVERSDLSGWHFVSNYDNGSGGTTNSLGLIDKTGTPLGYFWGTKTSDGTQISSGFLDGDGAWSYLAVKDNYTAFRINNVEKMRINSAGNVGIGTANPLAGLEVNAQATPAWSSFNLGANIVVRGAGRNNTIGFVSSNNSYPWAIGTRNDGTFRTSIMPPLGDTSVPPQDVLVINQSGNLGVGTASPVGRLHVYSGSAGGVTPGGSFDDLVIENSGSAGLSILTADAGAAGFYFGTPSDSIGAQMFWHHNNNLMRLGTHKTGADLTLEAGEGVEAIRIDGSTGNVGIGTVNPQSKFHVVGSIDLGATRSSLGQSTIDIWNATTFQPAVGVSPDEGGEFRIMGNPDSVDARSFIVDSFKQTMRVFPLVSPGSNKSIINFWHNNLGSTSAEGRVGINMSSNGAVPASALQVDGTIRAKEYCDYTGTNCFFAGDVGSGGGGGGTDQDLQQVLTVGNNAGGLNITNLNRLDVNQICLGGDCKTAWPTGGGGGLPTEETVTIGCFIDGSFGVSCSATCPSDDPGFTNWSLTSWAVGNWTSAGTGNCNNQIDVSGNRGTCSDPNTAEAVGTCTRYAL